MKKIWKFLTRKKKTLEKPPESAHIYNTVIAKNKEFEFMEWWEKGEDV